MAFVISEEADASEVLLLAIAIQGDLLKLVVMWISSSRK
jgi:hypothetical protein